MFGKTLNKLNFLIFVIGAELGCQNGSQVAFDAGYSEGLARAWFPPIV